MITITDILAASNDIKNFIHKTPLIYSNSFSAMTGAEVYIKAENLQKTGSFKVRGAFNKMLHIMSKKVIAASMGNHAQGVAYAAGRLGLEAKIVMPVSSSMVKQEAAKGYGAEVIIQGENFTEALDYALVQKDSVFVHAFDDNDIIAGQGTAGIEITEDLKGIDYVLVPVGGGGLISGISVAVKDASPATKIIGVQTESALSACNSFKKNEIVEMPPLPTLADGIAVGRAGNLAFEIIMKYVDDMIPVREDSIAEAILFFMERTKLVTEGAGAAPLDALMENSSLFRGKRVVLFASGGNIDFTLVDRIIHKGLVKSGRIGVFEVIVDDLPGRLHSLTGIISLQRGNILNVVHDRLAGDVPVGKTRVVFTIEAHGRRHFDYIVSDLRIKGFEVREKMQ